MLEIVWTLVGFVGMTIGWTNLRYSRDDIKALHEMNGNTLEKYRAMRVIAYGHYRNDLFRFAKQVTITVVGVISMLLPPVRQSQPNTPSGIVITVAFFTIALLIVMASALDRRQREAMEEIEQ